MLVECGQRVVAELQDDRPAAERSNTLANERPVGLLDEKTQGRGARLEPGSELAQAAIVDPRVQDPDRAAAGEPDKGGRHHGAHHES